jgi:hypothetical protein
LPNPIFEEVFMAYNWTNDMVEYEPGRWRSVDVVEYNREQWSPMSVMLWLIHSKFIELNTLTGQVRQFRDFKTGSSLEKSKILYPEQRGRYYYLKVEVPNSSKTSQAVGVKLHHLVYMVVHGSIPYGREVHHKDGNPENNGIGNLEALTPDEHRKVGKETGVHQNLNNRPRISRDDPVIQEILQLHESGQSLREIAREVGYSRLTCHRIVSGKYPFQEPTE